MGLDNIMGEFSPFRRSLTYFGHLCLKIARVAAGLNYFFSKKA
jgi:hypothetical protein